MSVRLQNGIEEINPTRLGGQPIVGQTVDAVFNDPSAKDLLNLTGNEPFEVRSLTGTDTYGAWTAANRTSYKFRDGDEVRFGRATGEKGVEVDNS